MEHDISFLSDEFKLQVEECKNQEDTVRRIKEEYLSALKILKANNKDRKSTINNIRQDKVQEINAELANAMAHYEELQKEKNQLLHTYCERNGHKREIIDSQYLGETGTHSFSLGFEANRRVTYRCVICGYEYSSVIKTYSRERINKTKPTIPENLYDDTTLREDGKTLNMISEEIDGILDYIEYLKYLLKMLCNMFGHDAEMYDSFYEMFRCKCCGKTMNCLEYIESHQHATYRGVIPYYYSDLPDQEYVIPSNKELVLSLPSYETYKDKK